MLDQYGFNKMPINALVSIIIIIYFQVRMSYRKAWTKQEDQALKQLYQNRRIKKWVQIAKILEIQFGIKGKNGKQCRQRYHNHLDQTIKHDKWCQDEQRELVALQNELGNKWAQISRVINGRSQNDIKNQFFSIMRRGLRLINSIIRTNLKRNSELEISLIYKIVERCQRSNKQKTVNKELMKNISLKKIILKYALLHPQESKIDRLKVQQVKQFISKLRNSNYKTKKSSKSQQKIDSQELEDSQLRDSVPLTKKIDQVKSFQSIKEEVKSNLQKSNPRGVIQEVEEQYAVQDNSKLLNLPYFQSKSKLKRRSSNMSNTSLELMNAHKLFQMAQQESMFKCNQGQYQFINTPTPRPLVSPSPYFDHPRNSFTNWGNFFST